MAGQDSGQGKCDTTLENTPLNEITNETDKRVVHYRGDSKFRTRPPIGWSYAPRKHPTLGPEGGARPNSRATPVTVYRGTSLIENTHPFRITIGP